jgi:hypothetical protein
VISRFEVVNLPSAQAPSTRDVPIASTSLPTLLGSTGLGRFLSVSTNQPCCDPSTNRSESPVGPINRFDAPEHGIQLWRWEIFTRPRCRDSLLLSAKGLHSHDQTRPNDQAELFDIGFLAIDQVDERIAPRRFRPILAGPCFTYTCFGHPDRWPWSRKGTVRPCIGDAWRIRRRGRFRRDGRRVDGWPCRRSVVECHGW